MAMTVWSGRRNVAIWTYSSFFPSSESDEDSVHWSARMAHAVPSMPIDSKGRTMSDSLSSVRVTP